MTNTCDPFNTGSGPGPGAAPAGLTEVPPLSAQVDRRTLLRAAGATTGGALVVGAAGAGTPATAAPTAFQHGIASGDPLPDGVLLWTRVTPTPESQPGSGAGPDVTVSWQVAADPDFTTLAAQGESGTGAALDHTVKVAAGGLAAATTYWYRFGYDGEWSPVGRTMTAPAADAAVNRLRMGVVSCASWEAGYFAAYRHLAARGDLNLIVHLGDYIYEYGTGEYGAGNRVVRPVPAGRARTAGLVRSDLPAGRPGRKPSPGARSPIRSWMIGNCVDHHRYQDAGLVARPRVPRLHQPRTARWPARGGLAIDQP